MVRIVCGVTKSRERIYSFMEQVRRRRPRSREELRRHVKVFLGMDVPGYRSEFSFFNYSQSSQCQIEQRYRLRHKFQPSIVTLQSNRPTDDGSIYGI
jgi:hypothetical protein